MTDDEYEDTLKRVEKKLKEDEEIAARKKYVKKLRKLADDYEDGNYHDQCAQMSAMADALEKGKLPVSPDALKVYNYIIKNMNTWTW